jgi:DNA-binding GntR family transcriptional regulator
MVGEEGFRLDGSVSPRLTAVELVRNTLRTAILRGDLPGGSELIQTDLAGQLGVSTTPVREAMRDLASEGLISLDNHRIGTVRTPEREEMVEIVEMRRSLEEVAIRRAMANITPDELDGAERLARELAEEEDVGSWVQRNIEFHKVFHNATRTIRLKMILSSLEEAGGSFVAQAQRLHPGIRRKAVQDHFASIEAYKSHDFEAAVAIEHRHVYLPLEAFQAPPTHDEATDRDPPGATTRAR